MITPLHKHNNLSPHTDGAKTIKQNGSIHRHENILLVFLGYPYWQSNEIYIFYEIFIANKIKANSLLVFRGKWFVYDLRGVNGTRTSLNLPFPKSLERDYVIKIRY